MLLLCEESVGLPLKIIFDNILLTGTFPDAWKLANVTPVFKKGDKQSPIDQYHYYQSAGKFLKKLFLITFILTLIPTIS